MKQPRGRPERGRELTLEPILKAAMALLEAGERGLTMRALAARLKVTPMSLYHHVEGRSGLLRLLAERVYSQVLEAGQDLVELMVHYHDAVGRHPQLTLALFSDAQALSGVTREITERITELLRGRVADPSLWRDILVDHAHGSGLALASAHGDRERSEILRRSYRQALGRLLGE